MFTDVALLSHLGLPCTSHTEEGKDKHAESCLHLPEAFQVLMDSYPAILATAASQLVDPLPLRMRCAEDET